MIETLVWDLNPSPGGTSQSHAVTLRPWKTWWRVSVSWRLEQTKLLTSRRHDDGIGKSFACLGWRGHTTHYMLEVTSISPKCLGYHRFSDEERVSVNLEDYQRLSTRRKCKMTGSHLWMATRKLRKLRFSLGIFRSLWETMQWHRQPCRISRCVRLSWLGSKLNRPLRHHLLHHLWASKSLLRRRTQDSYQYYAIVDRLCTCHGDLDRLTWDKYADDMNGTYFWRTGFITQGFVPTFPMSPDHLL